MNRSLERACRGKHRYDTEADARAAANRRRQAGIVVKAYRCPHGHHWHIGHPPLSEQLREITRGKDIRPRRRK